VTIIFLPFNIMIYPLLNLRKCDAMISRFFYRSFKLFEQLLYLAPVSTESQLKILACSPVVTGFADNARIQQFCDCFLISSPWRPSPEVVPQPHVHVEASEPLAAHLQQQFEIGPALVVERVAFQARLGALAAGL
jgi:hypothetical protein